MKKRFYQKLLLILTESELTRIYDINEESKMVLLDLHRLSCRDAKRFVNNLINATYNCTEDGYTLVIIHGFNHGTALRDMFDNEFDNKHVKNRERDSMNPGETRMIIA